MSARTVRAAIDSPPDVPPEGLYTATDSTAAPHRRDPYPSPSSGDSFATPRNSSFQTPSALPSVAERTADGPRTRHACISSPCVSLQERAYAAVMHMRPVALWGLFSRSFNFFC